MTTTVSGGIANIPGPRGRVVPGVVAPPTKFGREGGTELVETGYDLARRAIGKALERVPFEEGAGALAELADGRDDVLRMAEDYLGYTTFDVPLAAQVDALLLVGQARSQLAAGRAKQHLFTWLRRALRAA
jgi:hypothetical protein